MTASEFPRPYRLDTIGELPRDVAIEADEGERAALARRFGLIAIAAIAAEATLRRAGEIVHADGRLRAQITQACVATGEPVEARIDEAFALRFIPDVRSPDGDEIELSADDCDTIAYAGGAIDLGEAVAETLALALDPFPRGPAADAALREAGVLREGEEPRGAFAGLTEMLAERKSR